MAVSIGRKNDIFYLSESELLRQNVQDLVIISDDGTSFCLNRLLLTSCSQFVADIITGCGVIQEKVVMCSNIPTSHLEQLILLSTQGILTLHKDNLTLMKDANLLDSFKAFGIDLAKLQLSTGALEGQVGTAHLEGQVIQGSSTSNVHDLDPLICIKEELLYPDGYGDDDTYDNDDVEDEDFNYTDESQPILEVHARMKGKAKRKLKNADRESLEDPDFSPSKFDVSYSESERKRRRSKVRVSLFRFETEGERDLSKKFQCPHCIKGYSNKRDFELHVLRHESDLGKGWKCQRCPDVAFEIREDLKRHIEETHKWEIYACPYCPKTFKGTSYGHYQRHQTTHEKHMNAVSILCIACGHKAKSPKMLQNHLTMMGPFHNDKCVTCDQKMNSWTEHLIHVKNEHEGKMQYRCGKCEEVFPTAGFIRSHRLQMHGKQLTVCDECGESVSNIIIHTRKYHGTEEHPCPHCPMVLKHATVLKAHIDKAHLNLQCHECGKVMPNRAKYKLHMDSKHTPMNLKPYQCAICPDKGFATMAGLRDHNNIHTNERPNKCRFCGVGFNSRANMFNHERKCKSKPEQPEPDQPDSDELSESNE